GLGGLRRDDGDLLSPLLRAYPRGASRATRWGGDEGAARRRRGAVGGPAGFDVVARTATTGGDRAGAGARPAGARARRADCRARPAAGERDARARGAFGTFSHDRAVEPPAQRGESALRSRRRARPRARDRRPSGE